MAGTNPSDSADFLRFDSVAMEGNYGALRFTARPGRVYAVDQAQPAFGQWLPVQDNITGTTPPLADELSVVGLMDMGNTAALMKAYPVLPPRQSSYTKKAVWAKWMKVGFEKYFLWKMKKGLSSLP